jgi:predicted ArsR family transcriptional regulator
MEKLETDRDHQIGGIAALSEPVRRRLYQYVVGQGEDVTRDRAAQALGITRALAAFHLDKLVEEGLLEAVFRRLTGRTGPGAGRPSKLYRRSGRQFEVSLPPRSYELAAQLFARSIEESPEPGAVIRLGEVAREFGDRLGHEARQRAAPGAGGEELLEATEVVLEEYGYEPFRGESGEVRLRNCPFHALAERHRDLVCGMNLCLMEGVLSGANAEGIEAALDPQPGMCCVVFRPGTE